MAEQVYAPDRAVPGHPAKVRAIERKLNARWWLVSYVCGAWRLMPAWYDSECGGTYCQVHGVFTPEHAVTVSILPAARPGVSDPREGIA